MAGNACARDKAGLHLNTADTDCAHCNCDLFLSAIVSPDVPGVAVCPEHGAALGASPGRCVLLYKCVKRRLLLRYFCLLNRHCADTTP